MPKDVTTSRRPLAPAQSFADVLKVLPRAESSHENSLLAREPPPDIAKTHESIYFQAVDIVGYYNQSSGESEIHIFGVTELGNSVLARLIHVRHYFYVQQPKGFATEDEDSFKEYLNSLLDGPCVQGVKRTDRKVSPTKDAEAVLKISLKDHRRMDDVSKISLLEGKCVYKKLFVGRRATYGANVPYHIRFMLDNEIAGMPWLEVRNEEYRTVSPSRRVSFCQIEVSTKQLELCEGEKYKTMAPLRVLSIDIETDIHGTSFPDPSNEGVIQIGNMVSTYGPTSKPPFIRRIFTLDSCDPIEGVQVSSFGTETEMLSEWRKFFIEVDPDVVIGYNHIRFDIPFLLTRGRMLGLKEFAFLGRAKDVPLEVRSRPVEYNTAPGFTGRLSVDLFFHVRDRFQNLKDQGKLPNYKLDTVSLYFLHESKEDIVYTDIPILQAGDSSTRRQLAVYCMKDVYLPLRLLEEKRCIEYEVDKAAKATMPLDLLRVASWSTRAVIRKWTDATASENPYIVAD